MKKRYLVAAAATAAILGSYAQVNSPSPAGFLSRAESMYFDGNYFGCRDQLIEIEGSTLTNDELERMRYYFALATVHTDKNAAVPLLQQFLTEYAESFRYSEVMLALGDCYYGKDYAEALSIYRRVDVGTLNQSKADDLNYRKAYSYMMLGKYKEANPLFESLASSPTYANASTFYRGYIAYTKGDYGSAERLMKAVDTYSAPGNMADFYLSQIYFEREDYSKAFSMAKNLLKHKDISREYIAEMNRVAGESAYHLGEDAQAIKYLRQYVDMTQAPLSSALYILGYACYNSADFGSAIEYLTPVTSSDTAMGQSAYLYLGQAYMHEGDYEAAAMSFNRALNMDYDADVRETAYYNYAVASANGGNAPFASTVKIFNDFLRIFPESHYAPQVQEYIINSYLTDGNYIAALQSINEMKSPSKASLSAKQRVLYILGNKALAVGDYSQALVYLDEANTLAKYGPTLAPEVSLALGEAYYRKGEYKKSASEIQKYISSSPKGENLALAYYDLGYALYAQKKYSDAVKQFGKCINSPGNLSPAVIADAYNRQGDCYYFAKDFVKAEDAYDKAFSSNPNTGDYSLFQKALMAGYLRQHSKKIETLERMQREFPSSSLIPDALLETTEGYIQLGNNNKAIDVYGILVENFPNTAQARQGYLQRALVKLNSGNRAGAISDYEEVIRRYPASDEAKQAVEQMKRIATADGTIHDFSTFLNSIANAPQIDESEVEQLTFENAEREYLTEHKVDRLVKFVHDYPTSSMRVRALSYLLENALADHSPDKAYDYAVTIVEQYPESNYSQSALIVKAQSEEALGKGNLALRTWQQLAQTASSPSNLLTARMGVIRNGMAGRHPEEVLEAANAVISTSGVGTNDMAQAIYARGWVLDLKGEKEEARRQWQEIANHTDMLYGIMSAQRIGESYFEDKDYTEAEKWAKRVANADSPHAYWIARGFILLSDVYEARGDKYKARQYLEAVRDNYDGNGDDIMELINQRLK